MLLVGHLERYVRAVNEEAVAFLNDSSAPSAALDELIRLRHARRAIDELAQTQWHHRANSLASLFEGNAWLWTGGTAGELSHERLIDWMKSPNPKSLVKYYRGWGVHDVYESITRAQHTRQDLRLRIGEVVDKRNAIAHGDASVQATPSDVLTYRRAIRRFVDRCDRLLARRLARITGLPPPW